LIVQVRPVVGIPEVQPGDDIARHIFEATRADPPRDLDVIVIAHKIVSKTEERVVPGADRRSAALRESMRVLRRSGEMLISETRHGLVCANAGVDASNVPGDNVLLLPSDPDLSARRIRGRLEHLANVTLGVVISDTFGRAWRLGQTNVAIGVAGILPFADYRGATDDFGRELSATRVCIADELAGAAEMVMGKTGRIPAAVVSGAPVEFGRGTATEIVRPPGEDLFR
jgi:coenzyme F420-0:L-glutamate ligase / coenzyme F420-1:gamma-L-glutamate ligase